MCARRSIQRLAVLTPALSRPAVSSRNASGSMTVPAPSRQRTFGKEYARRDQVQFEHPSIVNHGVTGIVAALKSHNNISLRGQVVYNAALALVTPLCAYNCCHCQYFDRLRKERSSAHDLSSASVELNHVSHS